MLRWLQRLGDEEGGLEAIQHRFLQMIQDGRHIFDAASNALLGGTDPEVIREDLYRTDARINQTEQRIRRELVVHGTVHGPATFPALLVLMSIVKDAERIGDYAKNLFDLAVLGADMGPDAERRALVEAKDRVSRLLVRAHGLYESQDEEAARAFLAEADLLAKHCDQEVEAHLGLTDRNTAGVVLAYRYLKRVIAHASNIVTSIVMPLDKLDFVPGKPQREQ